MNRLSMKGKAISFVLCISMLTTGVSSVYATETNSTVEDIGFSSKRLLVGTSDVNDIREGDTVLSEYGGMYLIQYDTEDEAYQAYNDYYGNVEYVEPDSVVYTANSECLTSSVEEPMSEEANPLQILSEEVQSVSNMSGKVALIDTGVGESSNVVDRVSVLGGDAGDDNGHGTKMLSAMVEQNPDVEVLSIKAINANGVGTVSSVYSAMEYAIQSNVDYINLSLYTPKTQGSRILEDIIGVAIDKGITVVGAAGNSGNSADYYVPGCITDAMIVGSANSDGTKREDSNYGSTVDYNVVASSTSEAAAKMSGYLSLHGVVSGVNDNDLIYSTDYEGNDESQGTEDKKDTIDCVTVNTEDIAVIGHILDDVWHIVAYDEDTDFMMEYINFEDNYVIKDEVGSVVDINTVKPNLDKKEFFEQKIKENKESIDQGVTIAGSIGEPEMREYYAENGTLSDVPALHGLTRKQFVDYMESEEANSNSWFLNTTYGDGKNVGVENGQNMVQCTGFVSEAIRMAMWNKLGVHVNSADIPGNGMDATGRHGSVFQYNTHKHVIICPVIGVYTDDLDQLISAQEKCISFMLNSGILTKGDLIWSYDVFKNGLDPDGKLDSDFNSYIDGTAYNRSSYNHIGIFWGNTSDENRYWHSTDCNKEYIDIGKVVYGLNGVLAPIGEYNMYSGRRLGTQITNIVPKMGACIWEIADWGQSEGSVCVQKTSANANITSGNGNYSLAGAVYGVYTDYWCTAEVGTITTDSTGWGELGGLSLGTYYVKEKSASPGYELDTNVHTVTAE